MRFAIRALGVLAFGMVGATTVARSQTTSVLRELDRIRLAEARRLVDRLSDTIWPGWGGTELSTLLLADSAEFLVGHHPSSGGFVPLGRDSVLRADVWTRPRRFPPTLLATFPAVDGEPTVVIGSAERTNKASTAWVLTLLHEHFHQWQYSRLGYYEGVARLGLAHGDTTGLWMLNYPFPYDSAPVRRAVRGLAGALIRALAAGPNDRPAAIERVVAARDALRERLSPEDYRYLEFQLWQEGVARFIEYAAALAAAGDEQPPAVFRAVPDYQPYDRAADSALSSLRRELERLDLKRDRRVAFYPIGAAIARLLDAARPGWKEEYARQPFALASLLWAAR